MAQTVRKEQIAAEQQARRSLCPWSLARSPTQPLGCLRHSGGRWRGRDPVRAARGAAQARHRRRHAQLRDRLVLRPAASDELICATAPPVPPSGDIRKLNEAGIHTASGLMQISKRKLAQIKGLSEAKCEKIYEAGEKIAPISAWQSGKFLLEHRQANLFRLTTGCADFDKMLGGGIETKSITEVWSHSHALARHHHVHTQGHDRARSRMLKPASRHHAPCHGTPPATATPHLEQTSSAAALRRVSRRQEPDLPHSRSDGSAARGGRWYKRQVTSSILGPLWEADRHGSSAQSHPLAGGPQSTEDISHPWACPRSQVAKAAP